MASQNRRPAKNASAGAGRRYAHVILLRGRNLTVQSPQSSLLSFVPHVSLCVDDCRSQPKQNAAQKAPQHMQEAEPADAPPVFDPKKPPVLPKDSDLKEALEKLKKSLAEIEANEAKWSASIKGKPEVQKTKKKEADGLAAQLDKLRKDKATVVSKHDVIAAQLKTLSEVRRSVGLGWFADRESSASVRASRSTPATHRLSFLSHVYSFRSVRCPSFSCLLACVAGCARAEA